MDKKELWKALTEPTEYHCRTCKYDTNDLGNIHKNCSKCEMHEATDQIRGGWEWNGKK